MKSAFKNSERPPETSILLDDLLIDVGRRSVWRDNEALRLPDLSFDVLMALIEKAPAAVSADSLARTVWKTEHVTSETVAQRIRLLRRALGDKPKSPRYIRTVRNAGYACVASAESFCRTPPIPPQRRKTVLRNVGISTLALILAAAVYLVRATAPIDESGVAMASPPPVMLSMLERARGLMKAQQADETDQAIEMLREAHELDPSNIDVIVSLSFALSTRATKFRGTDFDASEAEQLARSALQTDPGMSSAWHALAYALDSQGRVDEALGSYTRAFELNPADVSAMSSAAYLLSVRGRFFEALSLEARAMSDRDYSRYADIQIAVALELVNHPAAEPWFSRAETLIRNQVVYLAEVASARLHSGAPNAALAVLSQESSSEISSLRLARIKGRAFLALGDRDTARTHFSAAKGWGEFDLAALDVLEGSDRLAIQQIRSAESSMISGNSWPGVRISLAEIYAALKDRTATLDYLSRAVDLGWRDIGAIEHSPYLQDIVLTDEWQQIRTRIERELEIQRNLIDGSSALSGLIGI